VKIGWGEERRVEVRVVKVKLHLKEVQSWREYIEGKAQE
jgi:hypothetical protein